MREGTPNLSCHQHRTLPQSSFDTTPSLLVSMALRMLVKHPKPKREAW